MGKTCDRVKAWTAWFLRVAVYLFLATLANLRNVWSWTSEPYGFQCNNPPRGAAYNRTKVKALVYGMAKTGTTSMSDLLSLIYGNAWHNEEFLIHLWAPLADRFWLKKENGGSLWPWGRLATPAYPAYKGHSFYSRWEHGSDRIANDGIDPQEIAEALEKCAVDALTFDAFENLFWKIYEVSPEAKIIMLNWRPFEDYARSMFNFRAEIVLGLFAFNILNCGQHYLPWNAFALPLLDLYLGHITDFMRRGVRMAEYDSLPLLLFRHSVTERRLCQHWLSGHGIVPPNKTQYDWIFDYGKQIIPKERLVEVNLKQHSPADVCKMLGVTDRPICKDTGKIPNVYPLMRIEAQRWYWMLAATPWWFFIHWVNYSLTWGVVYWVAGKMTALLGFGGNSLSEKRGKAKKS